MNSLKNMFVAFFLNMFLAVFEMIGGLYTGSIAIITDSIHDLGDAISILLSCITELISMKKPDSKYTYGYRKFSVLGSLITYTILTISSIFIIYTAVNKINNPTSINHNGMIMFAVIGVIINCIAVYMTINKKSINQKAVCLHMMQDVLNWVVVLIGAVIIKITNLVIIDPILSIFVALIVLNSSLKGIKEVFRIFLDKSPLDIELVKEELLKIDGVEDVHNIRINTVDGTYNIGTMHIVSKLDLKKEIKEKLKTIGINYSIIEFESILEDDEPYLI